MEISPSPNLQPGTNGPEKTEETQPVLLSKPTMRKRQKPVVTIQEPVSESEETAVVEVADVSDKVETLSPSDAKLAIKMNRHIMSVLGLDKRSRSFRV